MVFERIEKLKEDYTDKYVVVDPDRPELSRFGHLVGQVKTINMNGRALVQFLGDDIGWYDIDLDFLRIVDGPDAEPPRPKKAPAAREKPAAKAAKKPAAAKAAPAGKKMSTAEILAAARAKKAGGTAASAGAEKPAGKGKKMSTAEILAAARAKAKPAGGETATKPKEEKAASAAAEPAEKKSASPAKPRAKMSTAEILAAARAGKKAAPTTQPEGDSSESASGVATSSPAEAEPAVSEAEAPASEQSASAEVATEPQPAGDTAKKKVDRSALPKTTAEIIAYCRRVDGKKE